MAGERVETRMIGPVVMGTSNAILGIAVPSGKQWTTKQFIFTNTSGAEALIYLAIGSSVTAGNRILSALPVAAGDVVVWDTALVLNALESIQGYADRAGVNITVVGWEKTL